MIQIATAELDQTTWEFNADASRTYLAGFSLGGYGVWTTAATFPEKFAAIIPMSGRVLPRPGERKDVDDEILRLVDTTSPYAAFAQKIGKVPVWIFHGSDDPIVPVSNSRNMIKALNAAGNDNARYTELPNIGHVTLNSTFQDKELFDWLSRQQKDAK